MESTEEDHPSESEWFFVSSTKPKPRVFTDLCNLRPCQTGLNLHVLVDSFSTYHHKEKNFGNCVIVDETGCATATIYPIDGI